MNDMKTVWAIFSGEYSDWEVHGFCETEEEAKQVCAEMNDSDCWDEYYYEQLDKVSGRIESGVYEYCYRFSAISENGKSLYFVSEVKHDEPILTRHKAHRAPEVKQREDGICILPGQIRHYRAYIYVWLPGDDELERATKIAQDTWYKYLAEKSGV